MLYLHYIYLMDGEQADRYGQVLAKAEVEEVKESSYPYFPGIYWPGN